VQNSAGLAFVRESNITNLWALMHLALTIISAQYGELFSIAFSRGHIFLEASIKVISERCLSHISSMSQTAPIDLEGGNDIGVLPVDLTCPH
jgi:hypothetical protein